MTNKQILLTCIAQAKADNLPPEMGQATACALCYFFDIWPNRRATGTVDVHFRADAGNQESNPWNATYPDMHDEFDDAVIAVNYVYEEGSPVWLTSSSGMPLDVWTLAKLEFIIDKCSDNYFK